MIMRLPFAASILVVAALSGCGDAAWPSEMDAPSGLVPLPVSVGFRQALTGERLPNVTLIAEDIGIRVRVAKAAICATDGTAGFQLRGPSLNEVLVIASVFPNPAANCALSPSGVTEYQGVIPGLALGTYNVFVYEATGSGRVRFVGGGALQLR